MPELPEVETTRRGIEPHVVGRTVKKAVIRDSRLRWPIPTELATAIRNREILDVQRRAKYLLFRFANGSMLLHLGMSGHLRVVPAKTPAAKHDHVDILLNDGAMLRFNDPRRFGSIHWTTDDPLVHPLLNMLGPEPLSDELDGDYLFRLSRRRKVAVKLFIMNAHIVVGVGNIYASEALFLAGIRPGRAAGRVTRKEYAALTSAIKRVLEKAIKKGGTTLRDFTQPDGNTGYFSIHLNVYDRKDEPCRKCGEPIRQKVIGQRSTYWCANCQA